MSQEKLLFGQNEELQAIFIPASASSQGVKFFTNPTNDLQVGLMTRDEKSPVANHRHNKVKRIIETHGYTIQADSQLNKGTRFRFGLKKG